MASYSWREAKVADEREVIERDDIGGTAQSAAVARI